MSEKQQDTTDQSELPLGVPSLSSDDTAAFLSAYGPLRGLLKRRGNRLTAFGRWLAYARINQTPDEYLARAIRRTLLSTLVLVVVAVSGVVLLGVTSMLVPVAVGLGVVTFVAQYYYPLARAQLRRRRINTDLPHAIVFMYVLSEGGLDLPQILRRVANEKEVYGEVAHSFEDIISDIEQFNMDPLTALSEAKQRSPSTALAEFFDDLENVIESGGHLDTFFRNRSQAELEGARQRQENTLETIEAVVEGYVTLIFAAPVFLITILVVMAFTGIETLLVVDLIVYAFIPIGVFGFIVFFHIYGGPHERQIPVEVLEDGDVDFSVEAVSQMRAYRRSQRAQSIRQFLRDPLPAMRERPVLTLWFTAPLAALLWVGIVVTGTATPTVAGYEENPILTTTLLGVVPLLIPSAGLMIAYEVEKRREMLMRRRLPDILAGLASANRNGIRFAECISLVARRSTGKLATNVKQLDNEIKLTEDVHGSLRRFAASVNVGRVTRITSVLIEGHKTSANLADVLDISAEETRERHRLDIEWRHAMQPYVAFFIVGVFVYLFIILIFTEVFFDIIDGLDLETAQTGGFIGGEVALPTGAFETTLYHSLLIQAAGNGLAMGKLIDNSLMSGLKYANALIIIVVVVFYVV